MRIRNTAAVLNTYRNLSTDTVINGNVSVEQVHDGRGHNTLHPPACGPLPAALGPNHRGHGLRDN
jgi:hypothetical protein